MFIATHYEGKPAVLDTVARVYYYGFKTMMQAIKKAEALNKGE